MAKFYGNVGFATNVEAAPGVWIDQIIERPYSGDILQNYNKVESGEKVNDNINVSNIISVIADPFANNNAFSIRYICWMGTRWKVTSIDVTRPRLKLNVGGVYNGPIPEKITTTSATD